MVLLHTPLCTQWDNKFELFLDALMQTNVWKLTFSHLEVFLKLQVCSAVALSYTCPLTYKAIYCVRTQAVNYMYFSVIYGPAFQRKSTGALFSICNQLIITVLSLRVRLPWSQLSFRATINLNSSEPTHFQRKKKNPHTKHTTFP